MGILSKAATSMHGAVDQVADAAAPASQWLEEHGQTLGAKGGKLYEGASRYVAAHPLQSLGLALAAGYLISRLTR